MFTNQLLFQQYFSSIQLPFQQYAFHQSHLRLSIILLTNSASISTVFFINPASISAIGPYSFHQSLFFSAIFFSSIPLRFQQSSSHQSRLHFRKNFITPASVSARFF